MFGIMLVHKQTRYIVENHLFDGFFKEDVFIAAAYGRRHDFFCFGFGVQTMFVIQHQVGFRNNAAWLILVCNQQGPKAIHGKFFHNLG